MMVSTLTPFSLLTSSSSLVLASGLTTALLKSKSVSAERVILSAMGTTGRGLAGEAAREAGAAGAARGAGGVGAAFLGIRSASHSWVAMAGDQNPVRQHKPKASLTNAPRWSGKYPNSSGFHAEG